MLLNINFKQIEAFRAVMKSGSTTRAATLLHTTQPSISRRLAELQNTSRLKLFDLQRGRLQPTGDGEFLYQAIERHFLGLESIEAIISVMRRSGTKSLRLACTPTLGAGWLPTVVHRFMAAFPDTHVTIRTASTSQIEDLMDQNLIDVAMTTGQFRRNEAHSTVLERRGAACILSPGHRLSNVKHVELPMLAGDRLISISEDDELSGRIKIELSRHGLSDYFAVQTNSSITICALVAAGIGVGIVTPYIVDIFADQLIVKPLHAPITIELRIATSGNRAPSFLAREFVRFAHQKRVRREKKDR